MTYQNKAYTDILLTFKEKNIEIDKNKLYKIIMSVTLLRIIGNPAVSSGLLFHDIMTTIIS